MVNAINDMKSIDLKDIPNLKKGDYLYVEWVYNDYSSFRIIDKDMNVAVFDGVLYVFIDAELELKINAENIKFLVSFSLGDD